MNEHKVVALNYTLTNMEAQIELLLNEVAKDGWILVSVDHFVAYFHRLKQEEKNNEKVPV